MARALKRTRIYTWVKEISPHYTNPGRGEERRKNQENEVIMSVHYANVLDKHSSKISLIVYLYKWGFWIIQKFVITMLLDFEQNPTLTCWTMNYALALLHTLANEAIVLTSLSFINLCVTEHAVTSQKVCFKDMFSAPCWGFYLQQLRACMLK